MEKQHSYAIDHAKCIGIILVLFGHFPNNIINVLLPYTFHMPLFFFIGGILFNPYKDVKMFYKGIAVKYLFYIFLAYIFLGCSAKLLHNIFNTSDMNVFGSGVISTVRLAVENNFHNNLFYIVGWFLFSYMLLLTIAMPVIRLLSMSKTFIKPEIIITIFGLIVGYLAISYVSPEYKDSKEFYLNTLSQVMVGMMFFCLGYSSKGIIWNILNPYVAFSLFLLMYILRQYGMVTTTYMSWSTYNDGFYMSLLSAICGIYITMLFANMLSKYGDLNLSRYIGNNSKSIMTFHMLSFTLIDIAISSVGFFKINSSNIMQHFISPISFPLYMVLSIVTSLLIGKSLSFITFKRFS
ncbi:acyltransferase family protein [Enterobacter quasiroggenkampii]|uniref:acyltransferase family protein n=1 Tax=Enterobacter quasiroggenkampii TaxID=2497436 RepID=UPI0021D3A07C|nr:acyltransferase family protein [Enterobacter quasiroggenkampii]MCU6277027.1 acyltransferase family protein [Enterobacter quasiroggenkampii]